MRIVAWLVAVVLVALVANQLIATRVLRARVDGMLTDEIEHEYEKFQAHADRVGRAEPARGASTTSSTGTSAPG